MTLSSEVPTAAGQGLSELTLPHHLDTASLAAVAFQEMELAPSQDRQLSHVLRSLLDHLDSFLLSIFYHR